MTFQDKILKICRNFQARQAVKKKFIPGETTIQYAGAIFDELEFLAIMRAVGSGWWGIDKAAALFESRLAPWLGCQYGTVVSSGSTANLIALSSLLSKNSPIKVRPGNEVITAACGFPTTVNPIIQNCLKPVFVDVELGSYNADIDEIAKAISPKTRGLMLAHTLGGAYETSRLQALIKKYNLFFIEDCCDALGGKYYGQMLGSFGDLATTSFYPAHHITTAGEGGFVATNDLRLAKIVRSLRDWGRGCFCSGQKSLSPNGACGRRFSKWLPGIDEDIDHKYVYEEIGYNAQPLELQCAMGLVQLIRLPYFIRKRQENFAYLYKHLKKYQQFFYLPSRRSEAEPSWFAFPLTVKPQAPFKRTDIVGWLEKNKIQTRPIFAGNILRHPAYQGINCRVVGDLKNSDLVCANSFFIGVYPGITSAMRKYIVDKFEEFFKMI